MITPEQKDNIVKLMIQRSMRYYQKTLITTTQDYVMESRHSSLEYMDVLDSIIKLAEESQAKPGGTHTVRSWLAIIFGKEVEDILTAPIPNTTEITHD